MVIASNHSCPMGSVGAVSSHSAEKLVKKETHPKIQAVGWLTLLQRNLNVSHRLIGLHIHSRGPHNESGIWGQARVSGRDRKGGRKKGRKGKRKTD